MNTLLRTSLFLGMAATAPASFSQIVISNTSGGATANAFEGAMDTSPGARAIAFTAGISMQFSSLSVSIFDNNAVANATARVRIFQDNGSGLPGTLLSTLSDTDTSIPTTPETHTWTSGSTVNFTSGQTYWIVLDKNGGTPTLSWAKSNSGDGTSYTTSNGFTVVDTYTLSEDLSSATASSQNPFFSLTTTVPEPHEYALVAGVGLCAFAAYRRRTLAKA